MPLVVEVQDCGFAWSPVADLFGGQSADWLVTRGKMAGLYLREMDNPRWIEFQVWRLKGLDPRCVPSRLLVALKRRWVSLVELDAGEADVSYLDGLDPARPFSWEGRGG